MVFNKQIIKHHFDNACHSYQTVATIQSKCAALLVKKMVASFPDFFPSSILDLGSGTGYVIEYLTGVFPKSHYTVNDLSPKMIQKAQEKFSDSHQFTFYEGDMEEISLGFHDLTISNFALQWVNSLENTVKKYYAATDMLAFSLLLEGTFKEWQALMQAYHAEADLPTFPSLSQVIPFLNTLKPTLLIWDVQEFRLSFDTAYHCMKYLQSLGAHISVKKIPFSVLKKIILASHQKIDITYTVLFAILRKTS